MTDISIVVLDLDGTLIQSDQFVNLADSDFSVSHYWDDELSPEGVRVKVRPGVVELLDILSEKYHLALFSHSFPHYINEVLTGAGISRYFDHIFNNYDETNNQKDLKVVIERFGFNPEKDLNKIVIIDDNKWTAREKNLILIDTFQGGSDSLFTYDLFKLLDKIYNFS